MTLFIINHVERSVIELFASAVIDAVISMLRELQTFNAVLNINVASI